tara:strand:- start:2225 stop:2692 length:468 start_codon:yes stop_codon:yes gene_type:complete
MEEGMTPEEKAMVLQLMGQTYGEAHKQDQMIVGRSGNLSPKAEEMKEMFAHTAQLPTIDPNLQPHQQPIPAQAPQAPPAQPQPVEQVTPEQAAEEIAATQIPVQVTPEPDQGEFDFSEPSKVDQLISLVKKQTLLLEGIKLKLDNVKPAKSNKQK